MQNIIRSRRTVSKSAKRSSAFRKRGTSAFDRALGCVLASPVMNQPPNQPPTEKALATYFLMRTITRFRQVDWVWWIGAVMLIAAGLLFGLTLDNGLQPGELEGGDLITHQYAQVQARPSNAPGYPLYTMGGWLWFHSIRSLAQTFGLTNPNPIPLLSSYSMLWALVALWLLYRILCHLTRSTWQPIGDGWLAGLLCAFYAVTYFFWYYATTTEQYSSAIAQTLAIVYGYLCWQERQSSDTHVIHAATLPQVQRTTTTAAIMGLAFLCGLSLAHMVTVAFIVPPLVIVILWQAPQLLRAPRVVLGAVVAAFAPLLSYFYVYWRGAAHPEWWGRGPWTTPQAWFWAFVSTAQGREELGWGLGPHCQFFDNGFPALIWQELSIPVVIVGLIGLRFLEKRHAVFLYGTCVIYLIFCWAYRCGNWFQVVLPVYPLLLIGVAAFVHGLRRWQRWGTPLYRIGLILLIVASGWRFTLSVAAADSHNRPTDTAFDHAARLLAAPLPTQASLFAAVNDALALQYLSAIWQVRPDVQVIDSPAATQILASGQPVYSTWEAAPTLRAELPATLNTSQQALDAQWIGFYPTVKPPLVRPATILARTVMTDVVLQGYSITPAIASPLAPYRQAIAVDNQGLVLTLFWQLPTGVWPNGVSISVRPQVGGQPVADEQGRTMQQDRQQPALGLYTPVADQPIVDPYAFVIPAATLTKVDRVQLLLYRAVDNGFENLAEMVLPVVP